MANMKQLKFDRNTTGRGWAYSEFKDSYDTNCIIQLSSIFENDDFLWLGVNKPEVKILCRDAEKLGLPVETRNEQGEAVGWQNYQLPQGVEMFSRMHLTYKQTEQLIRELQKFMENNKNNTLKMGEISKVRNWGKRK